MSSFCFALRSVCAISPFLSFDWFYFLLYFVVAFNAFFIRRSCFLRFTSQPQLAISTVSRICIRTVTWSCVPRTTWMPLLLPCMWNCVNTLGLGLAAFLIELDLAICIFHIPSALFCIFISCFPQFFHFAAMYFIWLRLTPSFSFSCLGIPQCCWMMIELDSASELT